MKGFNDYHLLIQAQQFAVEFGLEKDGVAAGRHAVV
jgi:hypothetical protein